MPGFDTYTQVRQAEDVVDDIYNISPVDTPFCSMARTTRAKGKLHEWSEDALKPVVVNAQLEGADAVATTPEVIAELSNPCQIMTKVAQITGTLEVVDKYGRDSEMAYQLELRYGELANDEEAAAVGNPANAGRQAAVNPGDNMTARTFACVQNQLDASVKIDSATSNAAAAITTVAMLERDLIAGHLASYLEGGKPSYALTDPYTAGYFANFALSAGRTRDLRNDRMLVNVIDMYVSTYGELDVVLDRNMTQTNNCILGIDFNYAATPVLRATRDWPIAKTGDAETRQILRESTIAVLSTKAHFLIDNIPAGLTV